MPKDVEAADDHSDDSDVFIFHDFPLPELTTGGYLLVLQTANFRGWTPLHFAARKGDAMLVLMLLAANANCRHAKTDFGTSAIFTSAWVYSRTTNSFSYVCQDKIVLVYRLTT